MRTRVMDWFDLKEARHLYGLQVFSGGKWCYAAEGDKPCIYKTAAERDAKRAEFRRLPAQEQPR